MIRFLNEGSITEMHNELIHSYGGEPELRDASLLDSALNQPMLALHFLDASLCELAAAYGYHICQNHPLFDGNKRTARMVMIVFLRYHGLRITASEDETLDKMLDIANGRMSKQQLADWLLAVTTSIPLAE